MQSAYKVNRFHPSIVRSAIDEKYVERLIELEEPAHIFARLGCGNWNDCPAPEAHVALHMYWKQKLGAFPVAVSSSVVGCFVPRPPTESADLLNLAGKPHIYSYDIVEQGLGSKSKLAASLYRARTWCFWRD